MTDSVQPSARVLLVDDDVRLAQMLAEYLGKAGIAVDHRQDAGGGVSAALAGGFDAVLLDVMLPDFDGFEACRRIRARSGVPIVMLTGRGDETDRIVGLELGADDYLPKPFNPRELLARIKAVLRRSRPAGAAGGRSGGNPALLTFGELVIDPGARQVRLAGVRTELTGHQFDLLMALVQARGRVLSRDQLMRAVRGHALEAFDRSIDVHVSRIRAAIEDDPKSPSRILTVRGAGYMFTGQP